MNTRIVLHYFGLSLLYTINNQLSFYVLEVADPGTMLHANVHHMAVACEPITDAIARIAAQGDGPVTARKRLKGLT